MAQSFKPGDVIVWTQYSAPGAGWREPFERIGTVWSGAPTGEGLSNAWWVHPADPEPGEITAGGVIAVGRESRTSYRQYTEPGSHPAKGEVYGSWYWRHQAAALTAGGARWHREVRGDYEEAA